MGLSGQGTTTERVPFLGSSYRLIAAKPTKQRMVWEALLAGKEVGKDT